MYWSIRFPGARFSESSAAAALVPHGERAVCAVPLVRPNSPGVRHSCRSSANRLSVPGRMLAASVAAGFRPVSGRRRFRSRRLQYIESLFLLLSSLFLLHKFFQTHNLYKTHQSIIISKLYTTTSKSSHKNACMSAVLYGK